MSETRTLFMVREEPEGLEWLTWNGDWYTESRVATEDDLTLDRMAAFLDHHAEHANDHDFVGCHVALAEILMSEVGVKGSRDVMRRVLDRGGLRGLIHDR